MAFSPTTNSRGRGRLGSASTSSLSSIGTPPGTDSFFSLTHQHQPHLESQFNPPIDPQLFGLATEATLSETSLVGSNVIAGEVVAGGSTETYSDTDRLPSLGISVSGDEEDESKGEEKQNLKLERLEGGIQQQFSAAVDGSSASDHQLWDRVELPERGPGLTVRRRPSNSTFDLSEPEIDSDSDQGDEEIQKEPLESPSLLASSLPQGKRKRGRPRKHPIPVDPKGTSIQPPKSKKEINAWGKKVSKGGSRQTSPLQNVDKHGISMPEKSGEDQGSATEMGHNELGEEISDASDTSETPEMPETPHISRRTEWETTTPTFQRRGPGRPKKCGSKNKPFPKKPLPRDTSKTQPQRDIISDVGAQETPSIKRGPGRPRKTKVSVVGDVGIGIYGQTGTTSRKFTTGWRRSARERRSGLGSFRRKSLAEEDLKAPVMGQGSLKRAKKVMNYSAIRIGGSGSCGEGEERSVSRNERKGYIKKAELDRIRRGKITAKLMPPIHDNEPPPTFPPEFGFTLSYFRERSTLPSPHTAAFASSPSPPPRTAQSTLLPTPSPTHYEDESYDNQRPRKKARVWVGESDEGYEPITCLYTFAPTAEVFRDFEGFVKAISCVGKRQGCVRVKVPKECVPEPPSNPPEERRASRCTFEIIPPQRPRYADDARGRSMSQGSSRSSRASSGALSTSSCGSPSPSRSITFQDYGYEYGYGNYPDLLFNTYQYLSLHPRCTTYNPIYDVTTNRTYAIPAADFLSRRAWRDSIAVKSPEDLLNFEADCEKKLIERGLASIEEEENELNKITYSTDNEATPELRNMFRLSDLGLPRLSGNSLYKSEQQVPGIHTPYFYFASPASVFAMHMEDYAALSINFHHWGAPKRWVIICPQDAEKLENLVVGMLGLRNLTCDQFIRHASVFVPTWVLERAGIRHTQVLQQPGDMVITFPWAYHEGWNQGLNVAEAIGYGDVSWERWVRGYRACNKRCPLKPIEMRFPKEGFGEVTDGEEEEEEEDQEVVPEEEEEDEQEGEMGEKGEGEEEEEEEEEDGEEEEEEEEEEDEEEEGGVRNKLQENGNGSEMKQENDVQMRDFSSDRTTPNAGLQQGRRGLAEAKELSLPSDIEMPSVSSSPGPPHAPHPKNPNTHSNVPHDEKSDEDEDGE